MKKKCIILLISIGIFLGILPGIILYLEDDIMQYENYTDLGITSAQKPSNPHLFIEEADGDLWLVDSSTPSKLYKSTDKGDNWSLISTRSGSRVIESFWHDRTNSKLYFVEVDETANNGEVYASYIDLSDNSVNAIGGLIDDGQQTRIPDIWIRDGEIEVLLDDAFTANVYRWNDPNWDLKDSINLGSELESYVIVKDADEVYYYTDIVGSMQMVKYDGNVTLTGLDDIAGYSPPGINQRAIAYDGSGILYFIFNKDADSLDYLMSYTIATDTIAEVMQLNIIPMLDRNTASGVMEKAYHATEYKVYKLHDVLPYQWHLIAVPDSDAVFIAITDNFLMNNDGDMWEWEDVSAYVVKSIIRRKDMAVPTALFDLTNAYPLAKGMFIKIKDTFTTAGASSTATIFEGYVDTFINMKNQIATLVSPAKELFDIKPSGDYSGRSDEIIVDIIEAYCEYVTAGTLSNGGAMGTITFYGDKTFFEILNDLAWFDNFIWYLTPTGALYYNNGAVDSVEDLTVASHISSVTPLYGKRAINYVLIKGAYINGVQVTSDGSHDIDADIKLNGINPLERTHSHLDTAALCNTCATNVLSRFGTQAYLVDFDLRDGSIGLIQEGQTLTLTYSAGQVTIAETQFGIREVMYNARIGLGKYKVSDRII